MTSATESAGSLLEIYARRRSELVAVARRQHQVLVELGIDETQSEGARPAALVGDLIGRLESERLRVLVIGRFSAGKSTFINALLGQTVLPSSPVPTTGVLCEIRYADEEHKRARLLPKEGLGPRRPHDPIDLAIEDLGKELDNYVKIDSRDAEWTSRYDKLELYWPLRLCEQGVDIIDSVGLDDPDSRDRVTMEQTATADAMIYCMASHNAYSAKDKQVIKFLQSLGYRSILFVITYWDHVRDSAAIGETTEAEFVAQQRRNLSGSTELGEGGIVFVDSKAALLGRIRGDRGQVAGSGIEVAEQVLQRFLTEEKGRAKLLTSLWTLREVNRTARQAIPTRIDLWQTEAGELEKRYREAEAPLQTLETQRQLMVSKVELAARDIAREGRDLASRHLLELPERIKEWAKAYQLEGSIGFPPTKKNVQPVVEEVVRHLKEQTEESIARWTQEQLTPMVTARLQDLEDSLEESARAFVDKIDQLRIQVSVGVDSSSVEQRSASVLGRILAGTYTVMTGDFLTGGLGVLLGGKALATTIGLQIGAGILLGIFGLLNPVAIILATVASIVAGGFLNMAALKRGINKKVGEAVAERLASQREEIAGAIETKLAARLREIRDAFDAGLGGEIASVRGEVEAILAAKQQGQADADEEVRKLTALQDTNLSIEEQIDALMQEATSMAGIRRQPVGRGAQAAGVAG